MFSVAAALQTLAKGNYAGQCTLLHPERLLEPPGSVPQNKDSAGTSNRQGKFSNKFNLSGLCIIAQVAVPDSINGLIDNNGIFKTS